MGRSIPKSVCIDGIKSTGPGGSPEERVYEYEIDLITPMYGGGVVAGVNEQERPIRVPSIRGQLRFWWRATRGTAFTSLEELKKREAEIWGSTEKASPTWVGVSCDPYNKDKVRERAANYGFERYGPETYALFPAVNNGQNLVKEGLKFTVSLRCLKEHEVDVQCAVWAWVNFGGLGARTRRGCGALFCREFAPQNAQTFGTWLKERLQRYEVRSSPIEDLPHVSRKVLFGPEERASLAAWSTGLSVIKDFRQRPGLARSLGDLHPGRSYWPEPDTIRRALNHPASPHKPDPNKPDGFPRALFGLPIVFRFMNKGDPSTEAYPKGKKRMASPLIIRPIGTQDGQFLPLALFLDGTCPREVELKGSAASFGASQIVNPKFASYDKSPMGKPEKCSSKEKRSSKGDALEAFRAYLKEKGYEGVSL